MFDADSVESRSSRQESCKLIPTGGAPSGQGAGRQQEKEEVDIRSRVRSQAAQILDLALPWMGTDAGRRSLPSEGSERLLAHQRVVLVHHLLGDDAQGRHFRVRALRINHQQ